MSTAMASAGILVVGPEQAVQAVRNCCGQAQPISRVDDAFAALERLAGSGTSAAFVWMANLPSRADAALEAMRKVLGPGAKLFLIARPDEEPLARGLLPAGVDDYLIWPLQVREVNRALGSPAGNRRETADLDVAASSVSPMAISQLAEVFAHAEHDLAACLDRLTALVADQLHARGCTIELPDAMSVCGEAIGEPVLVADLDLGQGRKGKLTVGPRRSGAYSAADATLLQSYAAATSVVCRLAGAASHWQHEALTDELTGLLNRRGLMLRLPHILEVARRSRTPVTVLMFDIDDFKHYNDAYGHDAGDEILREAGQLFVRHTRRHDIVARYGGDEFVVVFWESDEPRKAGSKPPRDVLAVLNRFRKSLEKHEFRSIGPEAQGVLTISGGLVTFPWDAGSPDELITKADEALLLAKRQGKNRIWLIGEGSQ